jgi:hypothetical protein
MICLRILSRATLGVALLSAVLSPPRPAHAADTDKGRVVKPFNGKNLDGWVLNGPKENGKWTVGIAAWEPGNERELAVSPCGDQPGELINAVAHGLDILTQEKFGDATVSLEFMVPKGSNSGVYLMGEYEVQIVDGYGGSEPSPGGLGGLYGVAAPRVNAAKKPGEWQTLVAEYRAPRFENGKKVANARLVKAAINGQVIHENVEMPRSTGGGVTGRESPTGPLMLQGNHGVVAYRSIKVTLAE